MGGTPKTLDEAILNAISIGPLSKTQEGLYHHIRDFLAQKFGVAFMEAGSNKETIDLLENLFNQCIARGNDASDKSKTP